MVFIRGRTVENESFRLVGSSAGLSEDARLGKNRAFWKGGSTVVATFFTCTERRDTLLTNFGASGRVNGKG